MIIHLHTLLTNFCLSNRLYIKQASKSHIDIYQCDPILDQSVSAQTLAPRGLLVCPLSSSKFLAAIVATSRVYIASRSHVLLHADDFTRMGPFSAFVSSPDESSWQADLSSHCCCPFHASCGRCREIGMCLWHVVAHTIPDTLLTPAKRSSFL